MTLVLHNTGVSLADQIYAAGWPVWRRTDTSPAVIVLPEGSWVCLFQEAWARRVLLDSAQAVFRGQSVRVETAEGRELFGFVPN